MNEKEEIRDLKEQLQVEIASADAANEWSSTLFREVEALREENKKLREALSRLVQKKPNSEAQQMFSLLQADLPPKNYESVHPDETLETMQGILEMFFNDRVAPQIRSREVHGKVCKGFAYALKQNLFDIRGEDLQPPKKPRKKMELSDAEREARSKRMKEMHARKRREKEEAAKKAMK